MIQKRLITISGFHIAAVLLLYMGIVVFTQYLKYGREKMETKREIRKRVLARRDALTPAERMRSEVLLTDRILGHQWYYGAEEVLLFVSYGSEISTRKIMEDAFRQGKKVYVPKVMGENMEFYRILSEAELIKGYKGISEPEADEAKRFIYEEKRAEKALMIMPGAAFDRVRNRIGYGKGFYDRYLSDKDSLHTIAIGFDCQMVSVIESDKNDVRPMQVICL